MNEIEQLRSDLKFAKSREDYLMEVIRRLRRQLRVRGVIAIDDDGFEYNLPIKDTHYLDNGITVEVDDG